MGFLTVVLSGGISRLPGFTRPWRSNFTSYEWSPKFTLNKNTDFLIGYKETDIILSAEATHFTHPSLTDGTRLIGKANLSTPFNFGPIRLVPAANLHYTLYRKSKDGIYRDN